MTGINLTIQARKEAHEERIFQQWVAQLSLMGFTGNYVSFNDYKNRMTGANIDRRSVAEIEADLDEVERQLQGGGDD